MKKLLTLTVAGAILTASANAVQKCVALDAETTTCTSTPEYGKADWSATCTTNGLSVPITGIAACATSMAEVLSYKTLDTISLTSASSLGLTNCWCKMIEPAVSSWVYVAGYSDNNDCGYKCPYICANSAQTASAFRSALFGSISN